MMISPDPLERLIAIEAIKHLKARYFRYVDQQDWDAFRSIFCEDAHFEIGAGTFDGVDRFLNSVRSYLTEGRTVHQGHMPEIDILNENEATGIWTLFDRVEVPADRGRPSFYGYARYWERYRRQDDGWKISAMRIERLCEIPLAL